MKLLDLFGPFGLKTTTAPSLPEATRSGYGWFTSLPLAASLILLAAPLRAEFVYLSDSLHETITTYSVGSNGVLTQVGSPVSPGATNLGAGTIDPKGRFVFYLDAIGSQGNSNIWAYSVGSNGVLTPVPGSPFALGRNGSSLKVDPTGRFLYVLSSLGGNVISVYNIGITGTITAIPGSPFTVPGLLNTSYFAIDPSDRFLYVSGDFISSFGAGVSAFSIGSNGAVAVVPGSPITAGYSGGQVAVDPSSTYVYVCDDSGQTLYAYSIGAKGALTPVSGSPFTTGNFANSVTVDPTGRFVYVANLTDATVSVYSIYQGALTPISGSPFAITGATRVNSVTLDPTGRFAYVNDLIDGIIFTYSVGSDGGLTFVTSGITNSRITSFGFTPLLPPYIYVANQSNGGFNGSVSTFSTDSTGALLPVPGSPFPTYTESPFAAVDRTGKFVYVPDELYNQLIVYRIGSNGSLTEVSTVAAGSDPFGIALDPTGRFLYVTNNRANAVSAYTIGLNGTLTPVPGSPFATGSAPEGVTVDRSGKFVYVTNVSDNTVSAYKIGSNGALTPVSGSPFAAGSIPQALTVDPTGNFAYVANEGDNTLSVYSIGSSGGLTPVSGSPFATGQRPTSVTVDPTGRFVYVANGVDNTLSAYSIGSNGALTPVSGSPFATGHSPEFVTVDPTGSYAYVTNSSDNTTSAYTIGSNGALTPIPGSPFPGLNLPYALAVSPIPFAVSTTNFETEAGTLPTFNLSDSFTLGKNSTGINPVVQPVTLQIDTFSVTIPAHKFNLLTDGTFKFGGIINNVLYQVTVTPLGSNSFRFSAKASGQDLSTLGKRVPVVLTIGGNTGTSTASHKQ